MGLQVHSLTDVAFLCMLSRGLRDFTEAHEPSISRGRQCVGEALQQSLIVPKILESKIT